MGSFSAISLICFPSQFSEFPRITVSCAFAVLTHSLTVERQKNTINTQNHLIMFIQINGVRNKLLDITAVSQNIAYNGRAVCCVPWVGNEAYGFYFGGQFTIHLSD